MIQIRTAAASDGEQIYQLHLRAFGGRKEESELVERIRVSDGYVPELSLVAVEEETGEVVGHALISKAAVYDLDQPTEVLVLAPIGVDPAYQRQGIGGHLIREGLSRAEALGFKLVLLIGHPSYYPRFGFEPAGLHGLVLMQFVVPDEVFMVRELAPGELVRMRDERKGTVGELKYPQTFFA
ncbi:GNAT family N-acetyltransferase [Cohnella sp. REN36]|uniref:GNAT family N-acetyltransferase n=1 Tax=Cohnella sp. REN36 TaxID=2887347 RepID=UPI001D153029|nr:N-acetyltransferase [Cohnella sp. REN36]MCC3377377.1 N-acetyltransferase [Cohnella sp. REN36]